MPEAAATETGAALLRRSPWLEGGKQEVRQFISNFWLLLGRRLPRTAGTSVVGVPEGRRGSRLVSEL